MEKDIRILLGNPRNRAQRGIYLNLPFPSQEYHHAREEGKNNRNQPLVLRHITFVNVYRQQLLFSYCAGECYFIT